MQLIMIKDVRDEYALNSTIMFIFEIGNLIPNYKPGWPDDVGLDFGVCYSRTRPKAQSLGKSSPGPSSKAYLRNSPRRLPSGQRFNILAYCNARPPE
ncbi:hypothetical protein A2U01_0040427 [Trifolium medium]|uniref:Uncharacterized protein n=1 Tax=Trifolium medium TaxID=97028 RepID=A0A392Q4L8_9FABA|nr:hypothetical protein [Trifolium medium]